MGTLKTLTFAGVIAAGCVPSAFGADMLFPPPVHAVRPGLVEIGTGWYLRGDVGYVDYVAPANRREGFREGTFDTVRLDKETWSAGGGFGYKFLNWLRADVTVDHRFKSELHGTSSRTDYRSDSRRDWGEFETTTGLVNLYLDLGSWHGLTPYVGVGIGAAMNRLLEHRAQVTCLALDCGPLGDQEVLEARTRSSIDLAWALMGGVAVDVGGGFTVDAGYRYVNIGEVKTYGVGPDAPTRVDDIDAHEVRLGLRYMIDQ